MERHELMTPEGRPLTFEEFKERIDRVGELKSIIDKVSDLYEKIPSLIRVVQNFDPTGIAGAIDQVLSDNKAKREQENIERALYAFYQAILVIGTRQAKLDASINQHVADLTYLYFQKSKEAYDPRKIGFYKNIWINGVTRSEETLEEKAYVFEVISSLSVDEVTVLAYVEKQQGHQAFQERQPVNLREVAECINSSPHRAQQICIGLAGKGLLHDYGLGRFGYKGPENFVMTNYVSLIARYLIAP